MDIFFRFFVAVGLCALGVLVYSMWNRWHLSRNTPFGLTQWQPGQTALLYFTTPDCVPCRTVQRPAIDRLQRELAVRVIEIDATQSPQIADHWGVLSVPTTFIIDPQGKPRHVNHGVTPFEKLKQQLKGI
jgi:thiol-disulfide isomerase/thioredoxin